MSRVRIGVSGWSYGSWRGDFYPDDLPRDRELAFLAERFDTVEVNGTFYGLQRPDTFRRWYEETPSDFRFAVKGSRFITHNKKLAAPKGPLANFWAQGVLALGEKLGPVLWQLPGSLTFDEERVRRFLELLPPDTESAAALARDHDDRIEDAVVEVEENHRLRHALEIRHESTLVPELVRACRETGIALVFSHAADWLYTEELTAGFVYLRLHGSPETYRSPYDRDLRWWADRIRSWRSAEEPDDVQTITDRQPPPRKGRDVYVYFDNDQVGHAPRDAARLTELLEDEG
ncbi:MAG: DUF72 domain-containing protein [Thermoanaerobaculia bacterium]|nr:DUF72 domain-containing protein [Thermoanaerobaculia bacterium]